MQILLVEDNDLTREYVDACLGDAGHTVVAVASVEDALAQLEVDPPAMLLVTDFGLESVLDGVDVADRFKRVNPTAQVLVISADPAAARKKLASRAPNFGAFLSKPFLKAELLAAVEQAMKLSD